MASENNIVPNKQHIKNAKEYYDYYVGVDENKAIFYKDIMELNGSESLHRASAKIVKDVPVKNSIVVKKTIPLRQRIPRRGFAKTIAENIEEILLEQNRPLTVNELLLFIQQKGRNIIDSKNFSSQLISISKNKNRFSKEKINNRNYWGLSEWMNGIGFKIAFKDRMSNKKTGC